jgi:hypothetical protein
MAILFGTTSSGNTLPVLVDQFGNLLAKGIPGDEGPPGPPGGAFALPPDPVNGDVLGWENGQLVWIGEPPLPAGTFGPYVYYPNGSNLVVPQTPTLNNGDLLFMSDADGNQAYYTPETNTVSSVVVIQGGWNLTSAATNNWWEAIVYGADKFVAVAANGSGRVMYSTDGINWSPATATEQTQWRAVAYGDGKFVAVSSSGTNRVMYSTNGINWSSATAVAQNPWNAITYGDGKFVAVAGSATNTVMYSTDGINWSPASVSIGANWKSIAYGNGKYVAVAETGSSRIMYSTDAINWTLVPNTNYNEWKSIAYGDGKFVVVTAGGTDRVIYSTDCITWTAATTAPAASWQSITYGDGKFVAVGFTGSNPIMHSVDGINWSTATAPASNSYFRVAHGDGKFVSTAIFGTLDLIWSNTGTDDDDTQLTFNSPNPDLQYFQIGDEVQTPQVKVTSIDLNANTMNVDGGTWVVGVTTATGSDVSGTGSVDAVIGNQIDLQANNQQWIDGYYVTVQS